jgi:CarD family transcriptional regulator
VPATFVVGQKAVYPARGIAEVLGVELKEIQGRPQRFYVLQLQNAGPRILVPVDKVDHVGLRPVAGDAEVEEVLQILGERAMTLDRQTWNRRYRGFMEKIKSGSIFEVAEVFRDLHRLKTTKTLSFGEQRMLDTARDLVVEEISVARRQDAATVAQQLERALDRPTDADV